MRGKRGARQKVKVCKGESRSGGKDRGEQAKQQGKRSAVERKGNFVEQAETQQNKTEILTEKIVEHKRTEQNTVNQNRSKLDRV